MRAALAIHLAVYCAVAGCFAFGLHALMQPTRLANPGLSAYKAPPAAIIAQVPPTARHDTAPPVAVMAASDPEDEVATSVKPVAPAAEKPKPKAEKPRRQHAASAARKKRRNFYAYQPYYAYGYRPWY